jgi:probable rRNA maturation factor
MSQPLDLHITATTGHEHVPFLRKKLRAAHGLLPAHLRELSLALVGDARMSALHRRYRGIAGPTDVLSFELDHDRRGRVTVGEVVICVPQAVRQSRRHGNRIADELLLYALHGMLHLSGFDDTTGPGYQKMHAMEDKVLTRLGIGAVFSPGSPGAGAAGPPGRTTRPQPTRATRAKGGAR